MDKENIGFSLEYMNRNINPDENFYEYACGKWLERTVIPAHRSRYNTFMMLYERNMEILKDICERSSRNPKNSVERIVGDFYASAMDIDLIEKNGSRPLKKVFEIIDNISFDKLPEDLAKLTMSGIPIFFDIGSEGDLKNSDVYALYISQGGLSLPDRDYYINDMFSGVISKFNDHVKNMMDILGYSIDYKNLINIEKSLAEHSKSREDLRDLEKLYNKMSINDLDERYNNLGISRYLNSLGVNADYAIVTTPDYLSFLNDFIKGVDINDIKEYFKWHAINAYAPYLSNDFVMENFNFFGKILTGKEKIEERWERAIRVIDSSIGEALGELYVNERFGPEARQKAETLVNDVLSAFKSRLENIEWMSNETKKKALEKLSMFKTKIGYPDHFRDYSSIEIRRDDYPGNVLRSMVFELKRQLNRIGRPVDKGEWEMTPPTVNAYYNPVNNEIVFPAGILQPPFFDPGAYDAVNYGAIGTVIAHEITHGYDDQGSNFDGHGNMVQWWNDNDRQKFRELSEKIKKLYNGLEIIPGVKLNGGLTLGENIADIGGVLIAYDALKMRVNLNEKLNGLTNEQIFFISYAQIWREKVRDDEVKRLATIDPHSPGKFRGQIPVYNHPAFERAFNSKRKRDKIIIW
ncbi:M13 family metallopeptidase [Picrophilus oshimae]|uniref:Endothelin-converting enzyme Metallo peptidase. MEROPS family M13 n=1 Tax=Picrophilus torridus (strain ATCC 700027 / DSM 9790 / JCM 10055 / NBRC 100828 / KAW 2/3) TaxID=1122961 RepID=A0A8G2FXF3_PICTO|nr:M13 family metallopeptidase [Picrophilus oshimae]SMD31265.1 endothelin-converting enzyme Metallo peptidase. MEROPS family M13 [Picrophilus oshimae DSM 9789]